MPTTILQPVNTRHWKCKAVVKIRLPRAVHGIAPIHSRQGGGLIESFVYRHSFYDVLMRPWESIKPTKLKTHHEKRLPECRNTDEREQGR